MGSAATMPPAVGRSWGPRVRGRERLSECSSYPCQSALPKQPPAPSNARGRPPQTCAGPQRRATPAPT
eukprot:5309802-Pyramimonas_sp.AAC.1